MLPTLLARYSADNIYNVDERCLFLSACKQTYVLKGENASRNKKESKDRLTVLVAANMSGTDKLIPLV